MDAMSQDDQANEATSGESTEVAVLPPQPDEQPGPAPVPAQVEPRGIAPLWHTIVLILGIIAFSIWGSKSGTAGTINPFAPPAHDAAHAAADGTNSVRLIRYSEHLGNRARRRHGAGGGSRAGGRRIQHGVLGDAAVDGSNFGIGLPKSASACISRA